MPGLPWPFRRMVWPSSMPGGDLHVQRASVRQQHAAGGAVRGVQKAQGEGVVQVGTGRAEVAAAVAGVELAGEEFGDVVLGEARRVTAPYAPPA